MVKAVEGSGVIGLIKALSRNSPEATERNHDESVSGQTAIRIGFQTGTLGYEVILLCGDYGI
jgi:hypothetical protein